MTKIVLRHVTSIQMLHQ